MEIAVLTDTITTIINETLNQSDLIDPYKEIIESQRSTYNFIIYIFLAILGIIGSIAAYIYFKKSKDMIKEITKEIFDEERKIIISSIKDEYDKKFKEIGEKLEEEFAHIQATNARLFASTINGDKDPANKMVWMFTALEYYIIIDQGNFIYTMVQGIRHLCELLTKNEELKKKFISVCNDFLNDTSRYSSEYFIEILEKIPATLTKDRSEIRTFFNSIKDEISRGKKEEEKTKLNSTNS